MIIIIFIGATGFYLLETGEKCDASPRRHGNWCRFRKCNKPLPLCHKAVGKLDAIYLSIITLSTVGYGDIVPTNAYSRIWIAVVTTFGLSVFGALLDVCGAWRVACFGDHPSFRNQLIQCVSVLCLVLGVGVYGYTQLEGLTAFEALYLSAATLSTVGYGDLAPHSELGRLFTIAYILLGLGSFAFVVSCISNLLGPDSDTSFGLGGTECDDGNNSSSANSSLKLRSRCIKLVLLVAALVISSSTAIMSLEQHMSSFDALYFAVVTLTTIGYGDLTCLTGAGRALQMALSVVGLGIFADLTVESGRY